MDKINPHCCRIETLIGSLLYLMTVYRRERRREVAQAVATHLECLSQHPEAAEAVRHLANGLCDDWRRIPAPATLPAVH